MISPTGLCQCGCGQITRVWSRTVKSRGRVKGQSAAFVLGHHMRRESIGCIEEKLCECGCGLKAPLAPQSHTRFGWIKGRPMRFILGHNNHLRRLSPIEYLEIDMGHKTPCWIWQRGKDKNGYGRCHAKVAGSRTMLAHVYYYTQKHGPVPEGLQLDHLCRVPSCVNPGHLEVVSNAENTQRGLVAKLTPHQVSEIRRRLQKGDHRRELAGIYHVTQRTIYDVGRGKTWTNVTA